MEDVNHIADLVAQEGLNNFPDECLDAINEDLNIPVTLDSK
jgi:hypothetical protein